MKYILLKMAPIVSALSSTPGIVSAGEYGLENAVDTTWILFAAFLVFFMNLGFAMVESGMQRAKNASNICMKNLITPVIGSIAFFAVGFTLAFGSDTAGIIGNVFQFPFLESIAPMDIWSGTRVTSYAFFFFQAMFASTAATIVSGAVGERIKFAGYLLFSAIMIIAIYPFVAHWIWGGGWLYRLGMIDFAGSTAVHLVGGAAGLAGAMALGPRIGKYFNGKVNIIPGHSISLSTIGAIVLWFGWFGFNPGSTASALVPNIATIALTTNIAAAGGALSAMATSWWRSGKPDVGMTINGLLIGLVAITAGCASVSPASALMIGILAGMLVVLSVGFIDRFLKIDDPVGAISVHGIGGAFGTLMVGVFAQGAYTGSVNGLLFGGGLTLLGVQAIGVVCAFSFVFLSSYAIFKIIDIAIGLRVSREEEVVGLDISEHGMIAYPDFEVPS